MSGPAHRIAVVGAGLMGHGIARILVAGGHSVIVHDPAPEALATVRERVAIRLAGGDADPGLADRIVLEPDLEQAVAGVDWVFEAAPEDLELKRDLFARLDAAAAPEAILAGNSSAYRVGDVAQRARRRGRIIGTHWWNPPDIVPLVEVIQGVETDVAVLERTIELLRELGKTPVHIKRDVAGFVGNRLQHALWREAFQLVDDGVCDPETVDTVVRLGFGRRLAALGPIENADLVGLDLTLAIHSYLLPRLDPPSRPSGGLRERVERGELGAKHGAGWLDWPPERLQAVRERLDRALTSGPGDG